MALELTKREAAVIHAIVEDELEKWKAEPRNVLINSAIEWLEPVVDKLKAFVEAP